MGVVFAAFDDSLERRVAIKLIRVGEHKLSAQRLLLEATLMARVSHSHIVAVYEAGIVDDYVYIVMEYAPGSTLREWMAVHVDVKEILEMFLKVGSALGAAHECGIVHGDFKPENVLIGHDGSPRLTDFGLSRTFDISVGEVSGEEGRVMGTLMYMAPEQLAGKQDQHSDQFSFCVVLFESFFEDVPFQFETMKKYRESVYSGPSLPKQSHVPKVVCDALRRGLSAEPSSRFLHMDELLLVLDSGLRSVESRRQMPRYVALLVLLGVLVAAALVYQRGDAVDPCTKVTESIDELWQPDTQAKMAQLFEETNLPFAQSVWASVRLQVDDVVQRWKHQRVTTCRIANVDEMSPLIRGRRKCLMDAEVSLKSTLNIFSHADASVVGNAHEIVTSIFDISMCKNDAFSLAQGNLPVPEIAAEVENLQLQLIHIRADALSGNYTSAIKDAEDLAKRALKLQYMPLIIDSMALQGYTNILAGTTASTIQDGEEILQTAYVRAEEIGDDLRKLKILNHLMVSAIRHRSSQGLQWSDLALATVRRIGSPKKPHAEALRLRGTFELQEYRLPEALSYLQDAEKLTQGAQDMQRGRIMQDLGSALRRQGDLVGANKYYQMADAIFSNLLGSKHPVTTELGFDMAILALEKGELTEARSRMEEIVELHRLVLGENHFLNGKAHLELAEILRLMGELAEASEHIEAGLRIYKSLYPEGHIKLAYVYSRLGAIEYTRGKYKKAIEHYRSGLAIERQHGSNENARYSELNLAEALCATGSFDEAHEMLTSAEEYFAGHPDSTTIAFIRSLRGRILHGLTRYQAALPELQYAREIFDSSKGMWLEKASVYWALARVMRQLDSDEIEEIERLEDRACSIFLAQVKVQKPPDLFVNCTQTPRRKL